MGPKGFKQVELWKWAFGAGSAGKQRHGGWVPKVDSFLLSCFVLFLSCLFQVIHPFKNRESKPIDLLLFRAWLEKAMAPHSSTLAWKVPWTEEPGGLQSMGLLRVGHDWATSLSLFTFMHWRRKWQPTPVFLPGESQGQRSLVGCHLWGCTESDTTEVT